MNDDGVSLPPGPPDRDLAWRDEPRLEMPPPAPPPAPTKSAATLALVLGLLALIPGWGLFLGAFAWWIGRRELQEIDAGLRDAGGRRKARIGRRLGIIGVVFWGIVMAIGTAVIVLAEDMLLDEDFSSEPASFPTESDRFVDLSIEDGKYLVQLEESSPPQLIRSFLARTTDTVSFEAEIAGPATSATPTAQSVGCWNGDSGYALTLSSTGHVALIEVISEARGQRRVLTDFTEAAPARPPGEVNAMRIDCLAGGTDPTVVTGWLNDQAVAGVAVPDGYDSFAAVGFWLLAGEPAAFTIDNALARAERPEDAIEAAAPLAHQRSVSAALGFANVGINFAVPDGWQERAIRGASESIWRHAVSPDPATDNAMVLVYLPEEIAEEMLGPAEDRLERALRDDPFAVPTEIAGRQGAKTILGEALFPTSTPVTGEMVVLFGDDASYLLAVQYEAADEEQMLAAWEAMLAAFDVP